MVLQQSDRICNGIHRVLQRIIRQDEISLRILQRDDGLTIVETVAHYRVDDDRIGELLLLGRCRQTGQQNSKYTNETFLSD